MTSIFKNKKGLGRGLSSLIGDTKTVSKNNKISVSDLIRNRYQPRKNFDEESLVELTNSIKARGIIQPIIARNSDKKGKYEIIAGERRWLAAQKAGLHEVPVVIVEADNKKALEFGIVENVQRHDLNPVEEAEGYKRLIDEFAYDQEQVANFIGKSRSHITNCLRLLTLTDDILDLLKKNKISQGHAKVLVGHENASNIVKKIIKKNLSVRQTENLVRIHKSYSKSQSASKDPNIRKLENDISEKIGLLVKIQNKRNNRGYLTFSYRDLDQLNYLIEIIKKHF
ncbi:ParB/RepB/Spo0J family partition protein [Candidatus Pelagibacter communis]|uniref:ParB/RepB/Spo0J family partition protein n=1 Tax=Pelagibacter ubique TaxID=198252 RepID=UPI00094C1581|nr:ParB/RepB/Spo0J family partition protein [Candidatus Pelagibacter ubique]